MATDGFTRVRKRKMRYGEPDFDHGYLEWGFHDEATQAREAQSILRLLPPRTGLRILDIGCGPGRHAAAWARAGHSVCAIDISATFVAYARHRHALPGLQFSVGDVRTLAAAAQYDAITWIERPFFDADVAQRIHAALRPDGCFITDVRNPQHPRSQRRNGDWRTWHERPGAFYLERHETNPATGKHEDVWITIDLERRHITEEFEETHGNTKGPAALLEPLTRAGFAAPELRTLEGEPFTEGPEPYWLWLVARKHRDST